jgi:pseudouridine-5'-phosphate glycosidase
MHELLVIAEEVHDALADRSPVVALESTIFSNLGLPSPHNAEALDRCDAAIRAQGAVPAMSAVIDGMWHIGVSGDDVGRVLLGARKVAERDLSVASAQRWDVGVTTVSATMALAHLAGISVFATGGIGGVHRGSEITGDFSADLDALASHPVITVCAGAKAFLDLTKTLEVLETWGVPVLGWQHDWFPAFYTRSSGLRVPHRVESADEVADVLRFRARESTGALLTVPIPEAAALDTDRIDRALDAALTACEEEGITGAAVTPFILGKIERETSGLSVPANLALAENNARVAALVASAIASP